MVITSKFLVSNLLLKPHFFGYRLENLIFDSKTQKLSAVLDWELSTLGDPIFDLASCCLPHYIPRKFSFLSG